MPDHASTDSQAPPRLSFPRFAPTVSLGRHQSRRHEVRESWCAEAGIAVTHRETAGGALYLDPGQQCFTLTLPRAWLGHDLTTRLARAAEILGDGLARLGVTTAFKAPNDLQVDGRQKIASVFLHEEGDMATVFGTVIVTLDLAAAMKALLVPTEKLTVTGLEHARERMTSLTDLLGRTPTCTEIETALTAAFAAALGPDLTLIPAGNPASVVPPPVPETFETKDKVPGATLRLSLDLDAGGQVTAAALTTDGHVTPASLPVDLARALIGQPVAHLADTAAVWLTDHPADMAGFTAADILRLIDRAQSKWQLQDSLGLTPAQTSGLMLAGPGDDPTLALERASVMLVPYCAKPNWCKWRHTVDCVECGQCEVGDAYALARERNMEVVTITNFEHLAQTLDAMKGAGVASYVGMCCGEFFLKRHHAFRESGMDAVLLDIEGATCYELKEEQLAYAGAFTAEAALDIDAVRKVMARVPALPAGQRPCLTGDAPRVGERHHDLVASGCAKCSSRKAV